MISLFDRLVRLRLRLPAVLIVCLLPTTLRAETAVFRNECPVPVLVEARWVVRGVLKRDQQLLRPGQTSPKIDTACDKVLHIYDGKSGRLLFRDALRINPLPKAYGIVPDPRRPNGVVLQPRVLVATP